MWLTRISVNNPVFAAMMMLTLMVMGLYSFRYIDEEEFPNVDFPVAIISTSYPGASPEVVETDISKPLEEEINTIAGLDSVRSISREGSSMVFAQFKLEVNSQQAIADVRDKIALVKPQFKKEVQEPVVFRWNPDDAPIVSISLRSDTLGMRELSSLAEQRIKRTFQTISGVGRVNFYGNAKREIQINLIPGRMAALGIGVEQIINTLKTENRDMPAGNIKLKNLDQTVELKARLETIEEFDRLVVARRQKSPIYLSQVAYVVDGQAEAETLAMINGERAISIDVVKMPGANVMQVAADIGKKIQLLNETLPKGTKLEIIRDQTVSIRRSLQTVMQTLLEGAAFAIGIVFVFLGSWRSTVITGLTLPISLLGTLFALYIFNFTINVMTLMALALCIGLLIDDAIVVRENIVRHAAKGKSRFDAAMDGTQEIGLAVLATTFAIVAVFLPVAFMGGIIGRFFFQFGVTVSAAVLISMFVSFTLDPMLSSVWSDRHTAGQKRGGITGPFLDWFEKMLVRVGETYAQLIAWSLKHRAITLLIAVGALIGSVLLLSFVGKEFTPKSDLNEVNVYFSAPAGANIEYLEQKALQLHHAIKELPEVTDTYVSLELNGNINPRILVKLVPKNKRTRGMFEIIDVLRSRLTRISGISITSIAPPDNLNGDQKPIQLSLQGPDLDELRKIADQLKTSLQKIPGIVDLDSTLKEARPISSIKINREAANDAGLSAGQIGSALRPFLAGEAVTTWKAPDGENYDVKVRLSKEAREAPNVLDELFFASSDVNPVTGVPIMLPLRAMAEIIPERSASQINRRDLFRVVLISANTQGRPSGDVGTDINAALAKMTLPDGYRVKIEGANGAMKESIDYATTSLMLAVVFIYILLASQFGSFTQPIAIMISLPLSFIGVFLALLLFRSTLNIFSIIGMLMLMGLVTKNSILLIDFVNQARARGVERTQALMDAGRHRLRPILMTTAAMICGMLPLAFGLGEGSEQRGPMAHALIGGVFTSTLLTLVVLPVIFSLLDDLTQISIRFLRRWF